MLGKFEEEEEGHLEEEEKGHLEEEEEEVELSVPQTVPRELYQARTNSFVTPNKIDMSFEEKRMQSKLRFFELEILPDISILKISIPTGERIQDIIDNDKFRESTPFKVIREQADANQFEIYGTFDFNTVRRLQNAGYRMTNFYINQYKIVDKPAHKIQVLIVTSDIDQMMRLIGTIHESTKDNLIKTSGKTYTNISYQEWQNEYEFQKGGAKTKFPPDLITFEASKNTEPKLRETFRNTPGIYEHSYMMTDDFVNDYGIWDPLYPELRRLDDEDQGPTIELPEHLTRHQALKSDMKATQQRNKIVNTIYTKIKPHYPKMNVNDPSVQAKSFQTYQQVVEQYILNQPLMRQKQSKLNRDIGKMQSKIGGSQTGGVNNLSGGAYGATTVKLCPEDDTASDDVFEYTTAQTMVPLWLNPFSPMNGLLVYWGVGAGKTCAAMLLFWIFSYTAWRKTHKALKKMRVRTPQQEKDIRILDKLKNPGTNYKRIWATTDELIAQLVGGQKNKELHFCFKDGADDKLISKDDPGGTAENPDMIMVTNENILSRMLARTSQAVSVLKLKNKNAHEFALNSETTTQNQRNIRFWNNDKRTKVYKQKYNKYKPGGRNASIFKHNWVLQKYKGSDVNGKSKTMYRWFRKYARGNIDPSTKDTTVPKGDLIDDKDYADPFERTVFVYDEAHKIFENTGGQNIHKDLLLAALRFSILKTEWMRKKGRQYDGVRLVLLTATPDYRLLNFFSPVRLPENPVEFKQKYFSNNKIVKSKFYKDIKGLVSYSDPTMDLTAFPMIVPPPIYFEKEALSDRVIDHLESSELKGVSKQNLGMKPFVEKGMLEDMYVLRVKAPKRVLKAINCTIQNQLSKGRPGKGESCNIEGMITEQYKGSDGNVYRIKNDCDIHNYLIELGKALRKHDKGTLRRERTLPTQTSELVDDMNDFADLLRGGSGTLKSVKQVKQMCKTNNPFNLDTDHGKGVMLTAITKKNKDAYANFCAKGNEGVKLTGEQLNAYLSQHGIKLKDVAVAQERQVKERKECKFDLKKCENKKYIYGGPKGKQAIELWEEIIAPKLARCYAQKTLYAGLIKYARRTKALGPSSVASVLYKGEGDLNIIRQHRVIRDFKKQAPKLLALLKNIRYLDAVDSARFRNYTQWLQKQPNPPKGWEQINRRILADRVPPKHKHFIYSSRGIDGKRDMDLGAQNVVATLKSSSAFWGDNKAPKYKRIINVREHLAQFGLKLGKQTSTKTTRVEGFGESEEIVECAGTVLVQTDDFNDILRNGNKAYGIKKNWINKPSDFFYYMRSENNRVVKNESTPSAEKNRNRDFSIVFNDKEFNAFGQIIRIVVVDPKFKEGIDIKHTRYGHRMEYPNDETDREQVEGRIRRRKGNVWSKVSYFVYDYTVPYGKLVPSQWEYRQFCEHQVLHPNDIEQRDRRTFDYSVGKHYQLILGKSMQNEVLKGMQEAAIDYRINMTDYGLQKIQASQNRNLVLKSLHKKCAKESLNPGIQTNTFPETVPTTDVTQPVLPWRDVAMTDGETPGEVVMGPPGGQPAPIRPQGNQFDREIQNVLNIKVSDPIEQSKARLGYLKMLTQRMGIEFTRDLIWHFDKTYPTDQTQTFIDEIAWAFENEPTIYRLYNLFRDLPPNLNKAILSRLGPANQICLLNMLEEVSPEEYRILLDTYRTHFPDVIRKLPERVNCKPIGRILSGTEIFGDADML